MPFIAWKRKKLDASAPQIEKDIVSAIDAEGGIHGSTTLTVVLGDGPNIRSVSKASPEELERINTHFHALLDEGVIAGVHYEDDEYDNRIVETGKIDSAVRAKAADIQAQLAEQKGA